MIKKRKLTPATSATGIQLPATDISPESPSHHLSALNNLIASETSERRDQIDQLRNELNAISADLRHSNSILSNNPDLHTTNLNQVNLNPVIGSTNKNPMNRDLDVEDLRRIDHDKKMVELTGLKDMIRSSVHTFSENFSSISAILSTNPDLPATYLNQVNLNPVTGSRNKDLMNGALDVVDLSRIDLDEKLVELNYLKDRIRSSVSTFSQIFRSISAILATNPDLHTTNLNQVNMNSVTGSRIKNPMNRDLDVEDLSRIDLDEKIVELTYLKDMVKSLVHTFSQNFTSISAILEINPDLHTTDLNQVKMNPARNKDSMNMDLDVEDLKLIDLDEKIVELTYLKDMLRSSVHTFSQNFTSISTEAEKKREELSKSVTRDMDRCVEENSNLVVKLVGDMEELMCRMKKEIEGLNVENIAFASRISALEEEGKKREELLRSVTHEMGLTKICLEEKGDLVVKLVRELEEVKIGKEKEVEILNAENNKLASTIFAMEFRLPENSTLEEEDVGSDVIDELVELKMQRSRLLSKVDIPCGMGAFTQLKIDELKSKMARENIVDKKRAKYENRMSSLVGELLKHKSCERKFGDAYRCCNENCDIKAAAIGLMWRELKMKADEAVDLRLQVKELVRDMEEMKCRKKEDVELLNAENKTLASKIIALEEDRRCSKEIRGQLRDEVLVEPKKESSTGSEENENHDVMEEKDVGSALIDELLELKMHSSQLLAKHDTAHRATEFTTRQMDDLERNLTKKYIGAQQKAAYKVQMVNFLRVLDNYKSAEMRIGADYRACKEKCEVKAAEIASMHREMKLKADEAVDLRVQLKELMKGKEKFEIMCNLLQLDRTWLTRECVKMRTHIDYLTAEKASLERHLETSQEELKDFQRTLMASVNASCSVISKLKKSAAEAVMGHEGAQDKFIRGHPVVEILVIHGGIGGDAEKPSSLARLRREIASSSAESIVNPYNDAVVIKASIENILVHRVLIDSGSSVNVLYKRAFERMRLDPNTLIPPGRPQFDSFGDKWEADGIVILPVTLGDDRGKYTRMTRFHVFNGPDHYNAIFGRPLLHDLQAVVDTYNLTMQFPADGRQVTIRGDVISARECYLRAVGALENSPQPEKGSG